jgi:hypothetical protein
MHLLGINLARKYVLEFIVDRDEHHVDREHVHPKGYQEQTKSGSMDLFSFLRARRKCRKYINITNRI